MNSAIFRRGQLIFRQVGAIRLLATLALIALALFIARYSWSTPFAQDAEGVLFDFRAALAAPLAKTDERIALVVYDEETLRATGRRSPVDRSLLAKALTRIDAMGARSIGIDILVDQPQPEDAALISAFRGMKTPTFLAYVTHASAPDKITAEGQAHLDELLKDVAPGNVRPASIRLDVEADNFLRRWPTHPDGMPPTLANLLASPPPAFADYAGSIRYRRSGNAEVPLFTTISILTFASDELFAVPEAAEEIAKQIRGRHIIIGGHVQDTDLFLTPLNRLGAPQMWGMDAFGHMLAQQLDNAAMPSARPPLVWALALIAVFAGIVTALADIRPVFVVPLFVGQMAAIALLPFWLQQQGYDTFGLPVFGWFTGWIVAFSAVAGAARAVGAEQRRFAQGALGKYLPRSIAAEILRDPDGLKLHGEKREIFAVFTDLEAFTKLSHAIEPEMVATLLNRYLETLSNIVLDHGGTIDKFVGDAVVAFWGAPIARPDDGERAIRAGWAMYEAGEAFRANVPDGVPAIGVTRVGVHFGEAIVGNFGGEGRIQYTALGDSMNTASRLESANKQLKSRMLVSAEAAERAGIDWLRPLGRVVLRGRATPVDIFEPVPELDADARGRMNALITGTLRHDADARIALTQFCDTHPGDHALRNLLQRTTQATEGGIFVLD